MLRYRLTLGPVLILLMIGLFWFDSYLDTITLTGFWKDIFLGREYLPAGLALFVMSLIVVPVASWELARILRANDIKASTWLTSVAGELGLIIHYCIPAQTTSGRTSAIICTSLVCMFVPALAFYSRHRTIEGVVAAAGGAMFAMIYLGFMLGFLLALRRWQSAWVVLAVIFITKMCDTGAFFTGKAIGRHKLIPWLSPGKTWEGLFGGLVSAVVLSLLFAWWGRSIGQISIHTHRIYNFAYSPAWAALCGILIGVVGQIGDLTASLLKRDAGIKDSSSILPGFGGILDMIDSPLLVAPIAYWMLVSFTS